MSIISLGNTSGVAGLPIAQMKGSEADRAVGEVGIQRRQLHHEHQAAVAAGVGEPDGEDFATSDRDADGRRLWKDRLLPDGNALHDSPRGKDPTQQSGNLLDLSG